MTINRLTSTLPATIEQNIGRIAESNLANLSRVIIAEIKHPDNCDRQDELLEVGMGLIRARDVVRNAVRKAERCRWEAAHR